MMFKSPTKFGFLAFTLALACSDDDGSDVQRKGPVVLMGGSGGEGGSASGDAGPGGSAGSAGSGGSSGSGGSGGSGGAPCIPVGLPDAGGLDASADASADGGGDASADGGALPRLVSFAADVHPIMLQKCGPCHVTIGYGGHNVASPDVEAAYADARRLGQELYNRVNGGGMPPPSAPAPNNCPDLAPPGTPGCLSVAEVELIGTWLAQCSPR